MQKNHPKAAPAFAPRTRPDRGFDLHHLAQEGGAAEGLSLEWMLDRMGTTPNHPPAQGAGR